MGDSPWGCKESDVTERLTHTRAMNLGNWGTVYKSHILSKFDTFLFVAFKI